MLTATESLSRTRPDRVAFIGPNWFAAVMGTGIVANAAAVLPSAPSALTAVATVVWVLDLLLLVAVVAATATHWRRHPTVARGHLGDPVMSHFWGAPAMALVTVGAGALLVGDRVLPASAAAGLGILSWVAGTALGLWTAVAITVASFTTHRTDPDSAFGGWLMPVVPPMVSAATGPLLAPHLPAGWAPGLVVVCLALFGATLLASGPIVVMLWSRLVHHKVGPVAMVPTLWIVLGPLGQSVTAAHTLSGLAGRTPELSALPWRLLALAFGIPVWGFALLWLAIAATITIRTARSGLPFSLTWWSFTFPFGTVVTATAGLASETGLPFLAVAAGMGWVLLVGAWLLVGVRTARGAWTGELLRAPVSSARAR